MLGKNHTFVVAEIGVNHNGDLELARESINAAKAAGADGVKFQTFKTSSLVGENVDKVQYQKETCGTKESHFEMLKALELTYEDFEDLKSYCDNLAIEFLSTPYDVDSAQFLMEQLSCRLTKVASADVVDDSLHEYLATRKEEIVIATGMATLGEIERAMSFYKETENLTLLQCVSNYPCAPENLNLNVMKTLKQSFNTKVGFSDHSNSLVSGAIATAMGAQFIEVHFTLDKKMKGPDHRASLDPEEFSKYVSTIRQAELMMGTSIKAPQEEELEMKRVSRKSLTFQKGLQKGHVLQKSDIVFKRPGTGLSGQSMTQILGRPLSHDVHENKIVELGDFIWS